MTRVACRLTAKNRDQLRNRTLGNRVWATLLRGVGNVRLAVTGGLQGSVVDIGSDVDGR